MSRPFVPSSMWNSKLTQKLVIQQSVSHLTVDFVTKPILSHGKDCVWNMLVTVGACPYSWRLVSTPTPDNR